MTELDIFVSDCQTVAQEGISRMENEMLSTFSTILDKPELIYGDYRFDLPTIPAIPDFESSAAYELLNTNLHTDHVWSSGESKYIWDQIESAFVSGGIGITKDLQNAIFQSDRERKLQTLNDSLQAVNASFGARGFSVPSNLLTGARSEIILKYQQDMENQSRDITKLMEEHARLNWQLCVERGISLEQFHADFTSKYDALYLDMVKTSIEKYRNDLEMELINFRANIENITARLEVSKSQATINTAAISAEIEKAKIEVDMAEKSAAINIQSHSSEVSRLTQAYASYAALVESFAKTASGGLLTVQTRKLT